VEALVGLRLGYACKWHARTAVHIAWLTIDLGFRMCNDLQDPARKLTEPRQSGTHSSLLKGVEEDLRARGRSHPCYRMMIPAVSFIVCVAAIMAMVSNLSFRYVWDPPPQGWGGKGIWIGDGGLGYVSYVSIVRRGSARRWCDVPVGFSLGSGLLVIDNWPRFSSKPMGRNYLTIPAWTLAIPSAALFVLCGREPLRQRRCRRCGLYVRCDYDLRGSVSSRCSECGAPISAGAGRLSSDSAAMPPG